MMRHTVPKLNWMQQKQFKREVYSNKCLQSEQKILNRQPNFKSEGTRKAN